MIEIKDLLNRFSKIIDNKDLEREAIASVLTNILKTQVEKKDVEIKRNVLRLNIKPIYKNEILIKREAINLELDKVLSSKDIKIF